MILKNKPLETVNGKGKIKMRNTGGISMNVKMFGRSVMRLDRADLRRM